MCSGSKSKLLSSNSVMESGACAKKENIHFNGSVLLELAACDDAAGFKREIEENGLDVNEASYWYSRRLGSKRMGLEERTPLMIAAMLGSVSVLEYLIGTGRVDVNRASSSDMATALHCVVAGGATSSLEIVKLLLDASADANCLDVTGNKSMDLFPSNSSTNPRRKLMELLLRSESSSEDEEEKFMTTPPQKKGFDKKEYPFDVSLPDINNGIYSTDEFRIYCFKVKPCSRAYSHDWTECPFVHPGENARRRDPRKYPYTCVPCPEFRKNSSCPKGDSCEFAHGVFESWLHPAQYRTRLCKDEIGCPRKVCFFAHKPEELRPVYDAMGTSTPPMSPLAASVTSSPKSGGSWQSKINVTPPFLQLPGSRLKSSLNARDLDLEMELLRLHNASNQMSSISSPTYTRLSELKPTNLDDVFGSLDSSLLSPSTPTLLNATQLRSSYPSKPTASLGFDSSAAVAAAIMNSRSSAFAKRSQSFIDRGAHLGVTAPTNVSSFCSSISDWSSPNGKLDWGIQGDELNKLRKSASFGFRNTNIATTPPPPMNFDEPDVSWVNTLVKDVPSGDGRGGNREPVPLWMDQLYMEQEQIVA